MNKYPDEFTSEYEEETTDPNQVKYPKTIR